MDNNTPRTLGRTGLRVGPLGLAAAYGAPASALETAFDAGCNYFYWGALRRRGMADAIRNITKRGLRDRLVVVVQVFARKPALVEASLRRGLRRLRLDDADVLLLGMYDPAWGERLLDSAERLRRLGAFRFLGISAHRRAVFAPAAADERVGVIHVRYSAAHRGAEQDVFPHLEPGNRPGVVVFNATNKGRLLRHPYVPASRPRPSAADCYRFVLSHPAVDCVTAGPADETELNEDLGTLREGPMSEAERQAMREVGDAVYARRANVDLRETRKALASLWGRWREGP